MQKITEQEALQRLTLLCSQAEHCQKEMLDKMDKWELTPEEQARIMQYLINEKYIDDTRYCRGYIHDKMAYNHWGRRKIEQMLWTKDIPRSISDPIFEKIPDSEWIDILRPLLQQKRKSTKGRNDYEINQKVIRFAISRGFLYEHIRQCIENTDEIDDF